jgi:hypothetical protein
VVKGPPFKNPLVAQVSAVLVRCRSQAVSSGPGVEKEDNRKFRKKKKRKRRK